MFTLGKVAGQERVAPKWIRSPTVQLSNGPSAVEMGPGTVSRLQTSESESHLAQVEPQTVPKAQGVAKEQQEKISQLQRDRFRSAPHLESDEKHLLFRALNGRAKLLGSVGFVAKLGTPNPMWFLSFCQTQNVGVQSIFLAPSLTLAKLSQVDRSNSCGFPTIQCGFPTNGHPTQLGCPQIPPQSLTFSGLNGNCR